MTTLIAVLAAMKAFDSILPMFSGGHKQERPEAAFLRVVETVVKRLCCIGKLFHLGRARRKVFGALLQAFDHAAILLKFLAFVAPFRDTLSARFACSRKAVSSAGQFFSCAGVSLSLICNGLILAFRTAIFQSFKISCAALLLVGFQCPFEQFVSRCQPRRMLH